MAIPVTAVCSTCSTRYAAMRRPAQYCAGRLIAAYRVLHVEQTAVTGIAIGDQGGRRTIGDDRHAAHHVAEGGDAGIRQSEMRRHGAVAGHVKGFETHLVGDTRGYSVKHAGRDKQLLLRQPWTEIRSL